MHIIGQICGDTCPGMHTALTFFYKYAQTVIFILFPPLPPFLSLSFLHMRVHTHTHTNTHTHTAPGRVHLIEFDIRTPTTWRRAKEGARTQTRKLIFLPQL